MAKSDLDHPAFKSEEAAREHLQSVRWPHGPVCPFCKGQEGVKALGGKSMGAGWFTCKPCRQKFTVRVGTLYERSHIPLHKWLLATHLLTSSKKGMSAHQLHRMLGITYKSAWFMAHRIREAMRPGEGSAPLGGEGKIVEADETYFGKLDEPRERTKKRYYPVTKGGRSGPANKRPIISLVERGGEVRSYYLGVADKLTVTKIVNENIAHESRVFTDESRLYGDVKAHFADHLTVRHSSGEYVRGEVHTNTIEGYFSIFKRGMKGVYQHCAEKHLHRYLAEFDFRYNTRTALGFNDADRALLALKGIEGKRLTYRRPHPTLV